jgi:aspartate/methionine/tyrosine aminotransferase
VALPKLLEQSKFIGEQIRTRVHSNFHVLQKIFADSSATVFRAEGGWYGILQLPQFHSDDVWAVELLRQRSILVHPGHYFDMKQQSCIVLSLLPPLEHFSGALVQIQSLVEHM